MILLAYLAQRPQGHPQSDTQRRNRMLVRVLLPETSRCWKELKEARATDLAAMLI